mmetsp:Transcript_20681/g.58908  ORF Transcript_20681/g.58908 Transcript_20681/m.58908 type:complete len:87 (+) Transcript_20681:2478-2738(+)
MEFNRRLPSKDIVDTAIVPTFSSVRLRCCAGLCMRADAAGAEKVLSESLLQPAFSGSDLRPAVHKMDGIHTLTTTHRHTNSHMLIK